MKMLIREDAYENKNNYFQRGRKTYVKYMRFERYEFLLKMCDENTRFLDVQKIRCLDPSGA